MNTTPTIHRGITSSHHDLDSPRRHIVGVVADPQSYRNLGYLLLGLPIGTLWFTVLVTALSVGFSMIVVALLGIPMLLGTWYLTRWFANAERLTANVLLGQQLAAAPMAAPAHGNPWSQLRSMSAEHDRRRELGFLMLRFPAGIATFTAAVTALAVPVVVAMAPFTARYGGEQPFGEWSHSARIEAAASSPWAWFLVPLGAVLLIGSFHLLNVLARACGRWTSAWLGNDREVARRTVQL